MKWVEGGGFAAVRTAIAALGADAPAAVTAETWKLNEVFAASPATVALVVVAVWVCAPLTMIR